MEDWFAPTVGWWSGPPVLAGNLPFYIKSGFDLLEQSTKEEFMQIITPVNQDAIRRLAYRLWEEGGRPEGMAEVHWQRAESQLKTDHPKVQMAAIHTQPKPELAKPESLKPEPPKEKLPSSRPSPRGRRRS